MYFNQVAEGTTRYDDIFADAKATEQEEEPSSMIAIAVLSGILAVIIIALLVTCIIIKG